MKILVFSHYLKIKIVAFLIFQLLSIQCLAEVAAPVGVASQESWPSSNVEKLKKIADMKKMERIMFSIGGLMLGCGLFVLGNESLQRTKGQVTNMEFKIDWNDLLILCELGGGAMCVGGGLLNLFFARSEAEIDCKYLEKIDKENQEEYARKYIQKYENNMENIKMSDIDKNVKAAEDAYFKKRNLINW